MRTARTLARLYKPSGWYDDAVKVVQALAHAAGTSPEHVATVVAALSPQTSVARNVFTTLALFSGQTELPAGTLSQSWSKALAGVASGPKVEAFRANLLGDFQRVTLDIWAWRALGHDIAPDIRHKANVATWNKATRTYQRAAELLGTSPAECQAGVWGSVRTSADYRFITNPFLSGLVQRIATFGDEHKGYRTFTESMQWLEYNEVKPLARRVLAYLAGV